MRHAALLLLPLLTACDDFYSNPLFELFGGQEGEATGGDDNPVEEGEDASLDEEQGHSLGDIIVDTELIDSNGDTWDLHDSAGSPTLIAINAAWCPPCADSTATLESLWNDYGSDGLVVIELLVEDGAAEPPTVATLDAWVDANGVTYAVTHESVDPTATEDALRTAGTLPGGMYPSAILLDEDMRIHAAYEGSYVNTDGPPASIIADIEALLYAK